MIRPPRLARRFTRGYILFEALMSLSLLSIGIIGVNKAIRETIIVRGLGRDYTQANLLLQRLLANVELQPLLVEGSESGLFEGDLDRFKWKWQVSKVEVPPPPIPPDVPPEIANQFKLAIGSLTKIQATVSWERSGRKFEETAETLWNPEKLFIPPPPAP